MLLLSPLSVLAAPRTAWTVAALLVATVPPLSGQGWRLVFSLQVCLFKDRWRAQLRRLTESLWRFVVPWGGDFTDLTAAAQRRRGGDTHDGPEGGNRDLVLERARVAVWPVMTLWPCQWAVSRSQSWWFVVFTVLFLLIVFFYVLFIILFVLILLHRWPPVTLFALLTTVVITPSIVVTLQAGWRWELMEILSWRQGATFKRNTKWSAINLFLSLTLSRPPLQSYKLCGA